MTALRLIPVACVAVSMAFAASTMQSGKVELKSANALAFGPEGVLFVGDSVGSAVYALDVNDQKAVRSAAAVEVKAINEKLAAMLGTTTDQVAIQDVAVNPISKNVYLSVSRGKGPDAVPVIFCVDGAGKISELVLANIRHASVKLSDTPASERARMETITSLKYLNGKVMIAGLSNEEFSSSLRSIPYPFTEASKASGVEIWHASHGRFETNAPVRTFVPYEIDREPTILAAYTCTPLVRIPVSDLKPGAKVKGTTIAELGAGNRPLDMIVYNKDGKPYILMANNRRGVMKLPADNLAGFQGLTQKEDDKAGVPYETIAALQGVEQLDKLDDGKAVVLVASGTAKDLRSIPLP